MESGHPSATDEFAVVVETSPPGSAQSPTPEARLLRRLDGSIAPISEAEARAESVLAELVWMLGMELSARQNTAPDSPEIEQLQSQLALLVWDGFGRSETARTLLGDQPSPAWRLTKGLRLQLATDDADPIAALRRLSQTSWVATDELRHEVGELLLFGGAFAEAKDLLQGSADRRLLSLAQALGGDKTAARATLGASTDPIDVLWACSLLSSDARAEQEACLAQVLQGTDTAPAGHAGLPSAVSWEASLAAMEGLCVLRGHDGAAVQEILTRRLALYGGSGVLVERMEGMQGSSVVDAAITALQLAMRGTATGSVQDAQRVAPLWDALATLAKQRRELGAAVLRGVALLERARTLLSTRHQVGAADAYATLGNFLLTLEQAGPSSGESAAPGRAYLLLAALLYAQEATDKDSTASDRLGELCEGKALHEALVMWRLQGLLGAGKAGHAATLDLLSQLADGAAAQDSLRLAARVARAAEILRVPGGDSQELPPLPPGIPSPAEATELTTLMRRCRRRGDRLALGQIYRSWASQRMAGDAQGGAADLETYRVLGVLHRLWLDGSAETWEAGKTTLRASATRESCLLSRLARVVLSQKTNEAEQGTLQQEIEALVPDLHAVEVQARLLRRQGHLATELWSDGELAERCYRLLLSKLPEDVMALHGLARLRQQQLEPEQAVHLLQQAVGVALRSGQRGQPSVPEVLTTLLDVLPKQPDLAGRPGAQVVALLCCELGAVYEHLAQLHGEDTGPFEQAIACYSEALERDAHCRTAARALVTLYRELRRPYQLMAAIDVLLPLLSEAKQQGALYCELGHLAGQLAEQLQPTKEPGDQDLQAAQAMQQRAKVAYREALRCDVTLEQALVGLSTLCAATKDYAFLRDALTPLPQTESVLRLLEGSLSSLGEDGGRVSVLESQLAQLLERPGSSITELVTVGQKLIQLYLAGEKGGEAARTFLQLAKRAPEVLLGDVGAVSGLVDRLGALGHAHEQADILQRAISVLEQRTSTQGDSAATPTAQAAAEAQESGEKRRLLLRKLGTVQLEGLGQVAQATATFEQIRRQWPSDDVALRALSNLYSGPERSVEQTQVLHALLAVSSDAGEKSRVWLQLAESAEKAGKLDEAFRLYGLSFDADAANRVAFTAYERLCYRREQWSEVLRVYDIALKLIETQKSRSYRPADLYLRRGQVQMQYLQQPEGALQSYLRALETDAENDNTQATVERIYVAKNQWREILAMYEKRAGLVREDVKRVEILRRGARVATAKLRDVAETVRFYEKLHAVDPTDSEALDALETHYERSKDHEKLYALLSTRVALAIDEQAIISLNMRIAGLCEEGLRDHDRAIQAYRHVVEVQPTHREALDAMARLFEANERWAELIDVTRRQIRLVTDRAQKALLYFKCGSVTEAKFGKDDDAIRYYEAAVRTSAACLPALHSLRDIYIRREDWPRVTQTLELEAKLWTEDKEKAGVLAHVGQIYLDKLQNQARAVEFFEQALSVDRDCMPANRALFGLYFARGDWDRALVASQVLLQKAVRDGEPRERSDFYRKRALVGLRLGHVRAACEALTTALETFSENWQALDLLVVLARRPQLGYDLEPVCGELEKVYRRRELWTYLAKVLCAQAALLKRAGQVEEAASRLREALRLSPTEFAATEVLAELLLEQRDVAAARQVVQALLRADAAVVSPESVRNRLLARLRLADLWSTGVANADEEIQELRLLLAEEGSGPQDLLRKARLQLSHALFAADRYPEAQGELTGLLAELGEPTDEPTRGEAAAAWYLLGRCLDAEQEANDAAAAYQKALQADPAAVQPLLALCRRALRTNDVDEAERWLSAATKVCEVQDRPDVLIPAAQYEANQQARRAVARLWGATNPKRSHDLWLRLVQQGEEAIHPSEGRRAAGPPLETSALHWDLACDRTELARMQLRLGEGEAAETQVNLTLAHDLRHPDAYELLMQLCEQGDQVSRQERVRILAGLLGYVDLGSGRKGGPKLFGFREILSDTQLQKLLLPQALVAGSLWSLWLLLREGLARWVPAPVPPVVLPEGVEPTPASRAWDAALKLALSDAQRLFGLEADVFFVPELPTSYLTVEAPRKGEKPQIYLANQLLSRSESERRFVLGRAFLALRAGFSPLLRLLPAELAQWTRICRQLATNRSLAACDDTVQTFLAHLAPAERASLDELLRRGDAAEVERLWALVPTCLDRAGLAFCDDLPAALRMMAHEQGEPELTLGDGGTLCLLTPTGIAGGVALAHYWLSPDLARLCQSLRDSVRL